MSFTRQRRPSLADSTSIHAGLSSFATCTISDLVTLLVSISDRSTTNPFVSIFLCFLILGLGRWRRTVNLDVLVPKEFTDTHHIVLSSLSQAGLASQLSRPIIRSIDDALDLLEGLVIISIFLVPYHQ